MAKRVSDIFTQRFQYRQLWGTSDRGWANGAQNGVSLGNPGTNNTPTGNWTVAWFLDCTCQFYAYTKNDEDPDNFNVYIKIDIECHHNKLWTSNDTPSGGYIDIGAIYLSPDNKPAPPSTYREFTHNATTADSGSPIYLHNASGALSQLESDIGANNGTWLAGVICDNGTKEGKTITPGHDHDSSWGTHSGTDSSGWTITHTLVFTPSDYDDDGKMNLENVVIPFYIATRWWPSELVTKSGITTLFDFDLTGDPFSYVPWAIRKSGSWRSCDDHRDSNNNKNGLMVRKSGSFSHLILNSPLNPNVPGDSNGFRVVDKTKTGRRRFGVSPKTPAS